jgi:FlaA1/EpsC-like NDP-sugar epimerase
VRISGPDQLDITFLFSGRSDKARCERLTTNITNSVLSVCPMCQVREKACLDTLDARQRKLLSAEPLDVASARLPDGGAIIYRAATPEVALAICQVSEKQASSLAPNKRIICHPPKSARPVSRGHEKLFAGSTFYFGLLFLALGTIAFGIAFYLIARHEDLQAHLRALPRSIKRLIMLVLDAVLLPAALITALVVRHGKDWMELDGLNLMLMLAPMVAIPVFLGLGMYRAFIRYLELQMALTVASGITVAVLLLLGILYLLGMDGLRMEDAIVYWLVALLFVGGSRMLARAYLRQPGELVGTPERVIIYGAGDAGAQLAISLKGNSGLTPAAFVDDSPDLVGSVLYGIKVHPAGHLPTLIKELEVRQVLLATPSASKRQRKEIFDRLEHLGVRLRSIPDLASLIQGRAQISDIQDIGIEELIGRDPVPPVPGLLLKCIEGKVVLVTGAGGSIGSELCRQILALAPKKLVLLELSEYALYTIYEELTAHKEKFAFSAEIVPVLGSVISKNVLRRVLVQHQVNTIYHAAAYKHVPLVESNPLEGIRNNVIGSLRAAEAAIAEQVETFVLVSTDKAVRPANIMGASKRMAEFIVQAIGSSGGTRCCMVRFGNVLDSSGSVVPLFRKQIQDGGPVTVTHPDVTRYFMTIPEAAQLVLQAGAMARGGDVFVLDMGSPVRILDLARRMVHLSGGTVRDKEHPTGDIEIRFTGLRPGEKLYEELLITNSVSGTEHPLILRAIEDPVSWPALKAAVSAVEEACEQLDEAKAVSVLLSIVPVSVSERANTAEPGALDAENRRSPTLKLVS